MPPPELTPMPISPAMAESLRPLALALPMRSFSPARISGVNSGLSSETLGRSPRFMLWEPRSAPDMSCISTSPSSRSFRSLLLRERRRHHVLGFFQLNGSSVGRM